MQSLPTGARHDNEEVCVQKTEKTELCKKKKRKKKKWTHESTAEHIFCLNAV